MEANNMAAMRKVIKKILRTFYVGGDGYHYSRLNESIYRMIEDTLSSPPKNCDRFNTELDAQIAFLNEKWLISVDRESLLPRYDFNNWTDEMKRAYSAWLLATSETKGGTDGQ